MCPSTKGLVSEATSLLGYQRVLVIHIYRVSVHFILLCFFFNFLMCLLYVHVYGSMHIHSMFRGHRRISSVPSSPPYSLETEFLTNPEARLAASKPQQCPSCPLHSFHPCQHAFSHACYTLELGHSACTASALLSVVPSS